MIKMLKNTTAEEFKNALNEIKTETGIIYSDPRGIEYQVKNIEVSENYVEIEFIGGTRIRPQFAQIFYLKYINKKLEIQ